MSNEMARYDRDVEKFLKEILLTQQELKILVSERTKQIDSIEKKVGDLEAKVDSLEKVSASGQTLIKVFTLLFTAALTFIVGYLLKVLT
jgi:t-SNARE complex subunit (syntaxin)